MAECCLPVPVPQLMTLSLGMSHRRAELKSSGQRSGQRSSSPDCFAWPTMRPAQAHDECGDKAFQSSAIDVCPLFCERRDLSRSSPRLWPKY